MLINAYFKGIRGKFEARKYFRGPSAKAYSIFAISPLKYSKGYCTVTSSPFKDGGLRGNYQ